MITVTLQQIKDAEPCHDGWKKVLAANGGVNADFDKPFPLVSILDSNGLDDTLWVIASVAEMSEHDEILSEHSRFCALQVIEKIEPYCSKGGYSLIVKWLTTGDDNLREAAWSVARFAAESARSDAEPSDWVASDWVAADWVAADWFAAESVRFAADSSDWFSADSAAESARLAALSVAWSASDWSAGWDGARSIQENKLRELLGE